MTRKQKPTTASKKRASTERKAVKAVAHKKTAPPSGKRNALKPPPKKPDTHSAPAERVKSAEAKVDTEGTRGKGRR